MFKSFKFSVLISFFLFLVPILAFLNKINLPQISLLEVYLISASQFIFFLTILFLSLLTHYFFLKKKIEFKIFFLSNSLICFLLLFFQNVKSLLFFEKQNFILDEIFTLLIFVILYFSILYFFKKNFILICRFLIIFIFFQFSYFSYNFVNIKFGNEPEHNLEVRDADLLHNDIVFKKDKKDSSNIFFIILDGMMTLESAEKLNIIKNKKKIIDTLKKNKITYQEDFLVNYDQTYLSLATLLQGSYPVKENSNKYRTRKKFFPFFILNQKKDNNFFKILRKTNKDFYWLGNSGLSCQNNIYINCISDNKKLKFSSIVNLFYFDSIYIYLLNQILINKNSYESINFFINPKPKLNDNNIYLLHILNPHPPYYLDKNCEIQNNLMKKVTNGKIEIEYYGYAYNCLLNMANSFIKQISKYNNNDLIFIMGDHGWSFDEETMKNSNLNIKENRFKTFFSYKVPKKCGEIKKPSSIVNVMRFALICSGDAETIYLEDLQYISFPEGHNDYGKVFLKN